MCKQQQQNFCVDLYALTNDNIQYSELRDTTIKLAIMLPTSGQNDSYSKTQYVRALKWSISAVYFNLFGS